MISNTVLTDEAQAELSLSEQLMGDIVAIIREKVPMVNFVREKLGKERLHELCTYLYIIIVSIETDKRSFLLLAKTDFKMLWMEMGWFSCQLPKTTTQTN